MRDVPVRSWQIWSMGQHARRHHSPWVSGWQLLGIRGRRGVKDWENRQWYYWRWLQEQMSVFAGRLREVNAGDSIIRQRKKKRGICADGRNRPVQIKGGEIEESNKRDLTMENKWVTSSSPPFHHIPNSVGDKATRAFFVQCVRSRPSVEKRRAPSRDPSIASQ